MGQMEMRTRLARGFSLRFPKTRLRGRLESHISESRVIQTNGPHLSVYTGQLIRPSSARSVDIARKLVFLRCLIMLFAETVCKPFDERETPWTSRCRPAKRFRHAALRPHVRQERTKRMMNHPNPRCGSEAVTWSRPYHWPVFNDKGGFISRAPISAVAATDASTAAAAEAKAARPDNNNLVRACAAPSGNASQTFAPVRHLGLQMRRCTES
jgi:hypothetical protein